VEAGFPKPSCSTKKLERQSIQSEATVLKESMAQQSIDFVRVSTRKFHLFRRLAPVGQRFIDGLLPLSHLMPLAGHLPIAGLDFRIGHSRRSALAFVRLSPTDIGPAHHDASSLGHDLQGENVIGPSAGRV
jgi:hypothetical protein